MPPSRLALHSIVMVALFSSLALAEPKARVEPAKAHPGDPVLVIVTNTDVAPAGTAGAHELQFYRTKRGYLAVFALPLTGDVDTVAVKLHGVTKPLVVTIVSHIFADTKVAVEDDLANPSAAEGVVIDADNKAMLIALRKTDGPPQFTRAFLRPPGAVTSVFGEWRTFNDGQRSQHLGLDLVAKEGTAIHPINGGTVTFVGKTLLAGNAVVVAHGAGIASVYMHLSTIAVVVGDVVEQTSVLGSSGQTGRTNGPHRHIGVYVPGGFVDPARFFRLAVTPVATPVATRTANTH